MCKGPFPAMGFCAKKLFVSTQSVVFFVCFFFQSKKFNTFTFCTYIELKLRWASRP